MDIVGCRSKGEVLAGVVVMVRGGAWDWMDIVGCRSRGEVLAGVVGVVRGGARVAVEWKETYYVVMV